MSRMPDVHTRLDYAAAWVRGRTDLQPVLGLVLGSGLAALGDGLGDSVAVPYAEIPELPISTVEGHPGRLVVGLLGGVPVAALEGRVHGYEGVAAADLAFGVRLLARLGARALLLTNAAGAVNPELGPGDLVRIVDHLNLSGLNPLLGPNDARIGPRFPDMSEPYDARLGAILDGCAASLGTPLPRGVYACVAGPSYETPAEVRMLRVLGADVVGMSTVPEVIAARHMGIPVAALSVVSNLAAGLSQRPLSHAEVLAAGEAARSKLGKLLECFAPAAVR
ncbi:MAG TPA: purine-nucleoside phosphorylase [Anaeromyxobacteraceae bacterium]|nr:purine-nucleoside phosphorylase [Anaeromyxobacteraceae bacterium]